MTSTREIENALTAANPITRAEAGRLPLGDADAELLHEILAVPQPRRGATRPGAMRTRSRRRYVALAAAAAAIVAVLLTVTGGGESGKPEPAFAAELVRFAERSPLVLMDEPGWRVTYADEQSGVEGEMRFERAAAETELNWRAGSLRSWIRDRSGDAAFVTRVGVLGEPARVFEYRGTPGGREFTALWKDRGRVLEFRSTAPDAASFKSRLASLRRVDATTWLTALPASVVKAADHDRAVARMLRGVPLPPGFDPASIKAAGLSKDRYQLGATVAGTVACTWFQRWSQARHSGDERGVRKAIAALRSARDWPVLRGMSRDGAYPEVLEDYAAAMPSGRWYGRPLEGDVDSGLGCSQLGVKLAP
jgi:hypothetical protein